MSDHVERLLGNATAMGWTPQTLWASSMSEYRAALAGWNRAHGVPEPVDSAEVARVRRLVARAQQREVKRRGG